VPESDAIQQAITTIVAWSTRNDVYQETMRRAKCSLPQGTLWLLGRVAKSGPTRLTEIATALGVDNSTLTPQVQRLERLGLIVRQADPRDRRAALLHVTRSGRAVLARLHRTRAQMFNEILAGWSDRDRAQTARVLTRLAEQLDSWMADGPV